MSMNHLVVNFDGVVADTFVGSGGGKRTSFCGLCGAFGWRGM